MVKFPQIRKWKSISYSLRSIKNNLKPWNNGLYLSSFKVQNSSSILLRETFIGEQFLAARGWPVWPVSPTGLTGHAWQSPLLPLHGWNGKDSLPFTTPPTPLRPPLSHSRTRHHYLRSQGSTKEKEIPLWDLGSLTGLTDLPSRSFDFSFEITFKRYPIACFSSIYFSRP